MLLSKRAIQDEIKLGNLKIEREGNRPLKFDVDSIDIHLGDVVKAWKVPSGGTVRHTVRPTDNNGFDFGAFARENMMIVPPDQDGVITFRPGNFYNAVIEERVMLPSDIAMHVQGRSKLARLGLLVHLTAPHAHAGWEGKMNLEIYNLGPHFIELKAGMRIGQFTFWRVEKPEQIKTPGSFHAQNDPSGHVDP